MEGVVPEWRPLISLTNWTKFLSAQAAGLTERKGKEGKKKEVYSEVSNVGSQARWGWRKHVEG
jgi:hypothetical protein